MSEAPDTILETFENATPDRDYIIKIKTSEFTCLCPLTGQPDFASMQIEYIPDQLCIELKSLKMYFWSFRGRQAFHEAITNEILDTLCNKIHPRFMCLTADFNVRGGLYTTVTAKYRAEGWVEASTA